MILEPMYWTDTMIEDATLVPCGPLREGEDIKARFERTQRWWDELLGRETIKPFVVGALWDALTYDPDEEERILYGNGKPVPTGVLHVDGSE